MATLLDIKSQIAIYCKRKVADFLIATDDAVPTPTLYDILKPAINTAKRKAERVHDFRYSEIDATLVIPTATGGLISDALEASVPVDIKRVEAVSVPVSGGYAPIEFLTGDEYTARIRRQLGRWQYDQTKTLAELGVTFTNPLAYQNGLKILLEPVADFTFPVTVRLDAVKYLEPYDADGDSDFISIEGADYLFWGALAEVNKRWKEFVDRTEGNISDEEIKSNAAEALGTLIAWDQSMSDGTSTPTPPPAAK